MVLGVEARQVGRGQISKGNLCCKGLMKRLSWQNVVVKLTFSRDSCCTHTGLKGVRLEAGRLWGSRERDGG